MNIIEHYLIFLQEIADRGAPHHGMASRTPPGDTQEVEIDDEEADKQQKKKLK